MTQRQDAIAGLREQGDVSVLVVGGGINGAAVFRELALHGIDALLVDRGDFGCGTTAAPSRMIHAGLRYLEFGERDLVRESVVERNLLLQNCPHYVFPLPTTIPLKSRLSGMGNVIRRFLHLSPGKRAQYRGAWMVKLGLSTYDRFSEGNRQMPTHHFTPRAEAFQRHPGLHPETIMTATYYDAWITYPERLCLELILDAEAVCDGVRAVNYVSAHRTAGDRVTLRDELTGDEIQVRPKVVVNAAGAWIDSANRSLGRGETKLIAGTKGAHILLDNDELLAACDGEMLFYETPDSRAVLAMPWLGKALIGSTDIAVDDPDTARCDDDEIDYMIGCVAHLLPDVQIDRSQILSVFSGVRPLRSSAAATTGQMSRSHYCHVAPPGDDAKFPVYSMIGGKWTPFRAFGEQVMDRLLEHFGMERKVSTEAMPVGGGRDFPKGDDAKARWVARVAQARGLSQERVDTLLFRYGTAAERVAPYCTEEPDQPLEHHGGYTVREIEFILRNERVQHVDDLLLRRTAMALLGEASAELLDELLAIFARVHGWSEEQVAAERERTVELLLDRHRVDLT